MAYIPLSGEEREEIRVGIVHCESLSEIARGLGRAPSTICREVKRNGGRLRYSAVMAQDRADEKLSRPKLTLFEADAALAKRVTERLESLDSPMTIALDEGVSHETIYQGVYANGRRGLKAGLSRHLHRKRRRRKPRREGGGRAKKASPLGKFTSISRRPQGAESRFQVGHFEGDLIIGAGGKSAVVTVIDRKSRYGFLGALPYGHGAGENLERLVHLIGKIPEPLRRTLTWDQGREMAYWAQLQDAIGIDVYFADPHSPWQRPVNENFNWLVRRWLPKGTDLSIYSQHDLNAISRQINAMPRRSLGWQSAAECYHRAVVALTG